MAGIYIHIPFCRQACHYCNFHFSTNLKLKNGFVNALLKEINLRQNYLENENIETIYFGGGTPSILEISDLNEILKTIKDHFNVPEKAEITLEANPDDINEEKLNSWKSSSVNRLSIGVQSFFDEDLSWMNRIHNSSQSIESILMAMETGFSNLSIDLIYGMPDLTNERWLQNVQQAISLNIPHLSCYALTVEDKTALHHFITSSRTKNINTDDQAEQFTLLRNWLADAGYEHYEISNFSKPGFRSRHNSSYWQGKKYLGLGPSAHSYNGYSRQWNISNNSEYIQSIEQGKISAEVEQLSEVQKLNEYIMTTLRTCEGIDLDELKNKFSSRIASHLQDAVMNKKYDGFVNISKKNISLTKEGKLFADRIASDLFFDEAESRFIQDPLYENGFSGS